MKKADGIIIAVVLTVCAALFLFFRYGEQKHTNQMKAEIYASGRLLQTVSLTDERTREFVIENGKMILSIEQDGVAVSYADCPSRVCVRTGKITLPGQMITCLPNRVIVKLIGYSGFDQEVDVIAR
ncbi:MAG: NusG domain II-containing protein [Clostridiales bacterium]|jgi:hypothetical protein|nr:NusG domain II-containing protein [Clostridiales bacterium]